MGLSPGLLPGGVKLAEAGDALRARWPSLPAEPGLDAGGILRAAADGRIACLVLLGADPVSDFPDRDLALRALDGAGTVVAVDTFLNESSRRADVVLAAAAFSEKPGTTTNIEGRVSALSQKVTPVGTAHADWIIAVDLAARLGHDLGLGSVEEIWDEVRAVSPRHAALSATELGLDHDGIVNGSPGSTFSLADATTATPPLKGYGLRLSIGRQALRRRCRRVDVAVARRVGCRQRAAPEPLGRRPPRRARHHRRPGRVAEVHRAAPDRPRCAVSPGARRGWRRTRPIWRPTPSSTPARP